ncbi:hypothetical protein [Nitriliruptor alkaliphilus]|uniref:hypothetical protein n=1 Tax=Nitriliruptor alkaliphilus TaxID=427918 RepID=UPI000696320F|nr:hypothetical protein [Nitriliruptor alkaliphilus]
MPLETPADEVVLEVRLDGDELDPAACPHPAPRRAALLVLYLAHGAGPRGFVLTDVLATAVPAAAR